MAEVTTGELMMLQQGMTDQQRMIFMTQYAGERRTGRSRSC